MGFALSVHVTWETVRCCQCGVFFAVDSTLQTNWVRDKTLFYCPNGHVQSYTESAADKLKKQLADKERALAWERDRVSSLQKQVQRAEQAAKRLKRRIAVGVCPCCHRTVKQLAAHMKTKHPDFADVGT